MFSLHIEANIRLGLYIALYKVHICHCYSELLNGSFVTLHCSDYSEKLASGGGERKN